MILLRGCLVCRGDLALQNRRIEGDARDILVEEFECIQCQREYTRTFEPRRYSAPPVSRGRHLRKGGAADETTE